MTRQAKNQSKTALTARGVEDFFIRCKVPAGTKERWEDVKYRHGGAREAVLALLDSEARLEAIKRASIA